MKVYKIAVVVFGMVFGAGVFYSSAQEAISPAKKAEIEKIEKVMPMSPASVWLNSLLSAAPDEGIPADAWKAAAGKIDKQQGEEIKLGIIDKKFTIEELKVINQFYETAAGKKYFSAMPQVAQQMMVEEVRWQQKVVGQLADELKQKGFPVTTLQKYLDGLKPFNK